MTHTDLFENDGMKLINLLPRDGAAYYHGKILDASTADMYFSRCINELSWEHDRALIYGKEIVTKRKMAWYADEPVKYSYSGYTKTALVWPDFLRDMNQLVESHCGDAFNSCLCNFYSSGDEGMSWHSDAENVSLTLEHGSLLIMKGATQKNWLHSLPKTKKDIEPRVSLTFRQMRF